MKKLAALLIAAVYLVGCGYKNTFVYEGNPLVRDKYQDGKFYFYVCFTCSDTVSPGVRLCRCIHPSESRLFS